MTRRRDHVTLETKLASALLALGHVPFSHATMMTAKQIISLYNFDHNIPHAEGGSDEFWNLTPLGIMAHRKKTCEQDVPRIAKNKRIASNTAIHEAAMASKRGDYVAAAQILASAPKPPRTKKKIPSRPFPKGHRPLRSRNTFERRQA